MAMRRNARTCALAAFALTSFSLGGCVMQSTYNSMLAQQHAIEAVPRVPTPIV